MLDEKINEKNLTEMGLITKRLCKVCETEYETTRTDWSGTEKPIWGHHCSKCNNYTIRFDQDGFVETETITSGNYLLVFFTQHHQASIVERDMGDGATKDFRKVKNIELNELTHEVALQWVNKLKTYVIFQ